MNADINKNWYLLTLQNRTGTKGCWLRNTLDPSYKKPRLPFGGTSAKVHRLLEPLKIAHALMIQALAQVEENLDHQCFDLQNVYNIETHFDPTDDYRYIGQEYFSRQIGIPFLVEGFFLQYHGDYLRFSFDLTPLFPHGYQYGGYETFDIPRSIFNPIKVAADFYNEYVQRLFDIDFLIIPVKFMDALAGSYPRTPLPDGVVLLDI